LSRNRSKLKLGEEDPMLIGDGQGEGKERTAGKGEIV